MLWRALILLGAALLACCAAAGDPPKGIAGLQRNVEFTEYSPLSRSTELLRRLFSPLNALRIVEESTSSGKPLREQRVDLANETLRSTCRRMHRRTRTRSKIERAADRRRQPSCCASLFVRETFSNTESFAVRNSVQQIQGVARVINKVDALGRIKYQAKKSAGAGGRAAAVVFQYVSDLLTLLVYLGDETVRSVHRQEVSAVRCNDEAQGRVETAAGRQSHARTVGCRALKWPRNCRHPIVQGIGDIQPYAPDIVTVAIGTAAACRAQSHSRGSKNQGRRIGALGEPRADDRERFERRHLSRRQLEIDAHHGALVNHLAVGGDGTVQHVGDE